MPNNNYLVCKQFKMNKKKFPKKKFTAKTLVTKIKQMRDPALQSYAVRDKNREYNIWLRDPLSVPATSRKLAVQKLDFMHFNTMQPK